MGKATLNPLAARDSAIYSEPIAIGTRYTKPLVKHPLEGNDLQIPPLTQQ